MNSKVCGLSTININPEHFIRMTHDPTTSSFGKEPKKASVFHQAKYLLYLTR